MILGGAWQSLEGRGNSWRGVAILGALGDKAVDRQHRKEVPQDLGQSESVSRSPPRRPMPFGS